jgi:serine/threonine protein kinase
MKKIIDCSLEYPANMPEIAVRFVKNILKKNPDQRQSINQLLKHPLLQVSQTFHSLFWSLFITTFLNSFALWMIKSFNQINKPKNIQKKTTKWDIIKFTYINQSSNPCALINTHSACISVGKSNVSVLSPSCSPGVLQFPVLWSCSD